MTAALYDPDGGFFATGALRSSREGHFLTSPEVSPLFGETLARFVEEERARLDDPEDFAVVESGAGSGSLLQPLLGALDSPVAAWAVEVSPAARRALAALLPPERVVTALEDIPPPVTGVVLANELLDNLPAAVAVRIPDGWEERWVVAAGERLELAPHPARPEVAAWADRFGGPVAVGGVVEVQLAAAAWLRAALGLLAKGAVVVIDYGDTAEGLAPRRAEGTIRTYRAHHLGPHPLEAPGETDITADVNFTALLAVADEAGSATEYHRQEDFLGELGLRDRLGELRHRELALAREGDSMQRLRVRSLRTEAEALLHPRGLGDFRVLVARR